MNIHQSNAHGIGYVDPSTLSPVDPSTCGDNPCGLWDDVWVRDSCLNYLATCDPTNLLYVGAVQGGVTAAVQGTTGAAADAATQALKGTLASFVQNPVGLMLAGGIAFVLISSFTGSRRRR